MLTQPILTVLDYTSSGHVFLRLIDVQWTLSTHQKWSLLGAAISGITRTFWVWLSMNLVSQRGLLLGISVIYFLAPHINAVARRPPITHCILDTECRTTKNLVVSCYLAAFFIAYSGVTRALCMRSDYRRHKRLQER